jgi:hypothetical protein
MCKFFEIEGNMNLFDGIEHFSEILNTNGLLEQRLESVAGNTIYIGWSPHPNADASQPVWYIIHLVYDGADLIRVRLPDDGRKWTYIWDNRTDYFS